MSRLARIAAAVAFCVAGGVAFVSAAVAGEEPIASVTYALSWDDAIEEAAACNLPLVVHRHGFY